MDPAVINAVPILDSQSTQSNKSDRSKRSEKETKSSNDHKAREKSPKKSRSRKRVQPPVIDDDHSEELSMSQLAIMANTRKLKTQEELVESKASSHKPHSSSSDSSSDSSDDTKVARKRVKLLKKENNDPAKLTMDHTLEEIQAEYERASRSVQNEKTVAFYKQALLMGIRGIEFVSTPLGVDLDGWTESMSYSVDDYDEVLGELCEKDGGMGGMPPEMKFVFMIMSSAAMFSLTKNMAKMEPNGLVESLLGKVFPKTSMNPGVQEGGVDNQPSKLRGPEVPADELSAIIRTMQQAPVNTDILQQTADAADTKSVEMSVASVPGARKRGRPRKIPTNVVKIE